MSKPIGYYCNHTPGDDGLLSDMEQSWGSFFEELNQSEKLWLLFSLAGTMTATESAFYDPHAVDDCIAPVTERFDELSPSDQLGLIEFLVNQIKH